MAHPQYQKNRPAQTISPKDLSSQPAIRTVAKSPGMIAGTITSKDLAEKIAESHVVIRNWRIPRIKEVFPYEMQMQSADKYFPDAKGGPLFVDEPKTQGDLAACERKRVGMKQLGHRYLVITVGVDLFNCQEQLGAVHVVDNVG